MNENQEKFIIQLMLIRGIIPASLTKIMTIYMIFEKLKNKKIKMNTKLKVSKRASRQPPSKLGYTQVKKLQLNKQFLHLLPNQQMMLQLLLQKILKKLKEDLL